MVCMWPGTVRYTGLDLHGCHPSHSHILDASYSYDMHSDSSVQHATTSVLTEKMTIVVYI